MNLLSETKTAVASSGHRIKDIVFIGSLSSGHSCSWQQFCKLADRSYYDGPGAPIVATDLAIVFSDGSHMWRSEYDGSEWWEYIEPVSIPTKGLKPIKSLLASEQQVGWVKLFETNNREDTEVERTL